MFQHARPWLFMLLVCMFLLPAKGQTVLNTTATPGWTNNNGSGTVTFNFQNTNNYAIRITSIDAITNATGINHAAIWTKATAINGLPGAISTANGWTLAGSGDFYGIANISTLTTQNFLSGLNVIIPANTTYGMAITAYTQATTSSQRYFTMANVYLPLFTITAGGCKILMGTNISYGGGVPPAAPTNTPRGWIGKLTFEPACIPLASQVSINACESYTWPLNGQTYTASGNYLSVVSQVNTPGCFDSTTLHLTVNHTSSVNSTISAFNSYVWPTNGQTYTNSGIYTYTGVNAAGCDSVITLNLTINYVSAKMTLQHAVEIAPNAFEYDVVLTNTGPVNLALQGYSFGINHAAGIRGTGSFTHTFISRDTLLSSFPSGTAGYTASANHLRYISGNVQAGSELSLTPGMSVRLATMRVTNSVNFLSDVNPVLQMQMVAEAGKTQCIANCIFTPPGTGYSINGQTNSAATGTIQALTGSVNTPCFFLEPSTPFNASITANTPVTCYGMNTGSAEITISGSSSLATIGTTGTYTLDGNANVVFSASPFIVSNLMAGTHIISVTNAYGCIDTSQFLITQPLSSNLSYTSSSVSACGQYVWNGVTYTASVTATHSYTNMAGCDSVHTISITIYPNPVVTAYDVVKCIGGSIDLIGNPAGGVFSLPNPYAGLPTTYTYTYTDLHGCSSTSNTATITQTGCDVDLHVKLYIQGYYIGFGQMFPVLLNESVLVDSSITDTLTVELHNPEAPYGLIASQKAILHTDGSAVCTFNYFNETYYLTGSYYLVIRHRNGLTTWSANPVALNANSVMYDFSSGSDKALGDNLTEMEPGIWAIFNGDLNHDDNADLLDLPLIEDDITNYNFGYYQTDLNGDGNVDLLDVPILESNITNFIYSVQQSWSGTLPVVSSTSISSINGNSVTCGGNVLSDGGWPVTDRGICWSQLPHPTISDSLSNAGAGLGGFTNQLNNLMFSATYYARAFATNSVGTVYGNEFEIRVSPVFITDSLIMNFGIIGTCIDGTGDITACHFATGTIPAMAANTTYIGGQLSITNLGTIGSSWTSEARFNIYGSAPSGANLFSPALAGQGTSPSTSSNFTYTRPISVADISAMFNTLSAGSPVNIGYWATFNNLVVGSDISINQGGVSSATLKLFYQSYPSIVTNSVSNITSTSLLCGGNINTNNGPFITSRGVCWSTLPNPTILNSKTINGSGMGYFTSTVSGLNPNTTYYIRSYATNSNGTVYGNQVSTTTGP